MVADDGHVAALRVATDRVVGEFEFSDEQVKSAVEEFLAEMKAGLQKDGTMMNQIPTYVTSVPNGSEKGIYMAVDLGGTNFRVCSIQLHGDSTFGLNQSKVKIPAALMRPPTTSKQLFHFLALQIEQFLKEHHCEEYASHVQAVKAGAPATREVYDMGFTFSFPVSQVSINKGHLIRWTKGFDIPDAVGEDICGLLQREIDELMLPVRVAALVNDTVGTLMARSYTSPGQTGTVLGAIFGTGTNGAYVEKLERVTKLKDTSGFNASTGLMIINTEWGSFDNVLKSLPNTKYDEDLDATTPNPGIQMFEKRISGMYLGEIVRRAVVHLIDTDDVPLFKAKTSASNELLHTTPNLNRRGSSPAALFKPWGVDSSFLSTAAADGSEFLHVTRQAIERDFGVDAAGVEDARAVRRVAGAVGRRAARLAAVAIGAIVVNSGRLETDEVVDVGVDGSLVEYYPDFEKFIREALQAVPGIGEAGERKIRIGIAKDGSGVGAALIALAATRALT